AGFNPDRIDTLEAIRRVQPVPLLLIASEGDERIRPEVARALYEAARAPVKKLKMFGRDVPHGAAARIHPEVYSTALVGFLESALAEPVSVERSRAAPPAATSSSARASFPR